MQAPAAAAPLPEPTSAAATSGENLPDPASLKRLEPLAAQGEPQAQAQLGILLYLGRGVARDEERAFKLFGQAAARESAEAMFWLGRMYLLGDGPAAKEADADREAARWYFEAARRGHAEAQYTLGLLFMAGTGVEKNEDEARKWLKRAADAGHGAAREFVDPPK
jgi:TPR repeat protein